MNLTGVVVAGGFVQGGYQYQIQLSGADTQNRSNGHVNIFSATPIPSYTQGATVVVEFGVATPPVLAA